jgi:hypothetical protein
MTISPRFAPTAVMLLALAAAGCSSGGDDEGAGPDDSPVATAGPADPSAPVVEPTGGGQGNGEEQPPEVGSVIQGIAVAGNAGGTGSSDGGPGETEPYSQTIRFDDGSCRGWTPKDTSVPSTEGLEAGASVTIRNDTGEEIGSGRVESSTSFPVDENGNRIDEESGTATWRCEFLFSATIAVSELPPFVAIQVAGLEPWPAAFDPDRNQFVAIVPGAVEAPTGGTGPATTAPPPPDTSAPGTEGSAPPPDSAPPSVSSPEVTTPTS